MAGSHQVKRLVKMYGGKCHYCNRLTNRSEQNRYPTRDHIVPKAMGGPNAMDNYVLACLGCNNDRGTTLFYCDCQTCTTKIRQALADSASIRFMFDGIIGHNKPRIRKRDLGACGRAGEEPWSVRIGHGQKRFFTFEEAVAFATTGSFVKDKEYT